MNKADLKKLGFEDEDLAQQVIVLHGKDIESLKAANDAAAAEIELLKGQLLEAGTTIEGFKQMDIDGIKAAADEWKTKAETTKAEAEAALHTIKFDHALEKALSGAKAKNIKAVRALLNPDELKLAEDGSLEGLESQLEAIKDENDFLFESDEPAPRIVAGSQSKSVLSDLTVDAARKAAGLGR